MAATLKAVCTTGKVIPRKRLKDMLKIRVMEHERRYATYAAEVLRNVRNRRRAIKAAVPVVDLTPEQWWFVQCMFDHRCAYCSKRTKLTQDHLIPISKGGNHTVDNVVPACASCNTKKGSKCLSEWR